MKAKSIKGNSPEEISGGIIESIADGFTPTLAITFFSIKQDHITVTDMLDKKGIAILGTATEGEFIDRDVGESIPQGTKFQISLPPDLDIVDKVIIKSTAIKDNDLPYADAIILFACIEKKWTIGPLESDENEQLQKVWNTPM